MADKKQAEAQNKAADEQMQKVAEAVREVVVKQVYLPIFAKIAQSYNVPEPRNEEELSKLLKMADYLVEQQQAVDAAAGSPVDNAFNKLAAQAGVQEKKSADQLPVPESIFTDADIANLAKQAMTIMNTKVA